MKIIIINGVAQSGKDKFCDFVEKEIPIADFSTIDDIKVDAFEFGWDGVKDDRGRRLLSDLKSAAIRYNNGVFKYTVSHVTMIKREKKVNFIFIHCREPEEIQKLVDHYREQCTTLLIRRPGIPTPDNKSDQLVEDFKYDTTIENDEGLDKLKAMAYAFSLDLLKEEKEIKWVQR